MISRDFLPHSAVLKTPQEVDEDRNTIYDEGVQLETIRFVQNLQNGKGAMGFAPYYNATMYFDYEHSTPKDTQFFAGQIVIYNNRAYEVVDVAYPSFVGKNPEFAKVGLNESSFQCNTVT